MAYEHVQNDLDKLKGIGPKHKAMLKEIGVDSSKELRHRDPAHLKEMIEQRHGSVVGLSEQECRTWIEEAKAFNGLNDPANHPSSTLTAATLRAAGSSHRSSGPVR